MKRRRRNPTGLKMRDKKPRKKLIKKRLLGKPIRKICKEQNCHSRVMARKKGRPGRPPVYCLRHTKVIKRKPCASRGCNLLARPRSPGSGATPKYCKSHSIVFRRRASKSPPKTLPRRKKLRRKKRD